MASSRSVMVQVRSRPREVKLWRAAARRADMNLSEWIRYMCNACAVPPPPSVPPVVSGDQLTLPRVK